MRARGLLITASVTAAVFCLFSPLPLRAGSLAPRPLVNSWEIRDEVQPAPDATATVPRLLLSFSEYQDLVLFHPTVGYYSSGRVNFKSDFQTYPIALAPYFGQMAAEQIFRMWQGMRQAGTLQPQERFTIAEFGAGDGALAESILAYLDRKGRERDAGAAWRDFSSQLLYVCYDRSPALSKKQRTRNARFGRRFEAREADATNPEAAIPAGTLNGVVLSNELPDAFSAHKVILSADGSAEVAFVVPSLSGRNWSRFRKLVPASVAEIVIRDDRAVRTLLLKPSGERTYLSRTSFEALLQALISSHDYEPLAQALEFQELYLPVSAVPAVAAHLRRNAAAYAAELAKLDKGVVAYINLGAEQFIRGAGRILRAGYVVTIDYGYNWEGLLSQDDSSRLRTFGPAHRDANGAAELEDTSGQPTDEMETSDPYQGPTLNDLTTDVNFSLLAAQGDLAALRTVFYGPQSALRAGTPITLPDTHEWAQTFETNGHYKLMVQQKRGTDPAYSYPMRSPEELASGRATLNPQQRRKADEIENKLGAATAPASVR